jgi:hypothetical protein
MRTTLVTLLLLTSAACRDIKSTDVSGAWFLTADSQERLPLAQQNIAVRLLLDSRGTFKFSQVPEGLIHSLPQNSDAKITADGSWNLASRDGWTLVDLRFRSMKDGRDVGYNTHLYVSNSFSPPRLFYFQGDPDQGHRIEFERR